MKRLAVIETGADIGGAEINVLRLIPALRAKGWEPLFFLPADGEFARAVERQGARWVRFRSHAFQSTSRYIGRYKVIDPVAVTYDALVVRQAAGHIARLVQREQVDLVYTNAILGHIAGGLAARQAGRPCVWHLQEIVDPRAGAHLFLPCLNLFARSLPTRTICISRSVADQLRGSAVRAKVQVIANGVDTNTFYPHVFVAPTKRKSDSFQMVVGQVARLTPWKGQEVVLELAARAASANLPIRFVMVGQESFGLPGYRAWLEEQIRARGVEGRVCLYGWVDNMAELYNGLDMLIHPVLEPEPFGLVLAEAMACAKPVAVFAHGGAAEIVNSPEVGFPVKPGDVAGMWQAILQVYRDPARAALIAKRARQRIQSEFTFERFAARVIELFDSTIEHA